MALSDKIAQPSVPVVMFEMVPPAKGKPESVDAAVEEARKVKPLVDAINLPEIHDENRGEERTHKFVPRVEPRKLGSRIVREAGVEVIINRCVVYQQDQASWFRETREKYGVHDFILVGGESSKIQYPGPSVLQAAEQARSAGLNHGLGGITIPSRLHEADRIRRKQAAGITFYTTQVLFDPNDLVSLIQKLNGLNVRVFLSFTPVSNSRDLEFLRWLGADVPKDLDRFLLRDAPSGSHPPSPEAKEAAFTRSLDLARRILMDVFDNLPPDPPALGLNIEHINRRNFSPAIRMLEQLGGLYTQLVLSRAGGGLT